MTFRKLKFAYFGRSTTRCCGPFLFNENVELCKDEMNLDFYAKYFL